MGRHNHLAKCLCLIGLMCADVRADWPDFSVVSPFVAYSSVASATVERMEATFNGASVSTNFFYVCPVTNAPNAPGEGYYTNAVQTNRLYSHKVQAASLSQGYRYSPVIIETQGRKLASENLIQHGTQTETWTNITVVGGTTNQTVVTTNYPLWRVDDLWVNCTGYTSDQTRIVWDAAPASMPRSYLSAIDAGMFMCADGGNYVDHHLAEGGSFAGWFAQKLTTNWVWSQTNWDTGQGLWEAVSTNGPDNFPLMTAVKAVGYAGVGTVFTNTTITDRGTNYPRTVTNYYSGWQVGMYDTENVGVAETASRYLTNRTEKAYFTAATNIAYVVLAELASSREKETNPIRPGDTNAPGYDPIFNTGDTVPHGEARGFGGLDNLYYEDALPTNLFATAGWHLSRAHPYGAPWGCYTNSDGDTAEYAFPAKWSVVYGPDVQRIRETTNTPVLVVRSMTTNEVRCSGVSEPSLVPHPLDVEIIGSCWEPATPSQSVRYVTYTQVVAVASTGVFPLAHAFTKISSLSASDTVWGTAIAVPKDGLHLEVMWNTSHASFLPLENNGGYSPSASYTHFRKAMEERRDFLKELRWTWKQVGWFTNIVRQQFETNWLYAQHFYNDEPDPSYGDPVGATNSCGLFGTLVTTNRQTDSYWFRHATYCDESKYLTHSYGTIFFPECGEEGGPPVSYSYKYDFVWGEGFASEVQQTADATTIWSERLPAEVDLYTQWVTPSKFQLDSYEELANTRGTTFVSAVVSPYPTFTVLSTISKPVSQTNTIFSIAPTMDLSGTYESLAEYDLTTVSTNYCGDPPEIQSINANRDWSFNRLTRSETFIIPYFKQVARWEFAFP